MQYGTHTPDLLEYDGDIEKKLFKWFYGRTVSVSSKFYNERILRVYEKLIRIMTIIVTSRICYEVVVLQIMQPQRNILLIIMNSALWVAKWAIGTEMN